MPLLSSPQHSFRAAYILSTVPKLFIQKTQNTLHHHCHSSTTHSRPLPTASVTAPNQKVRIYTNADHTPVEKLASSLASAFEDDPIFLYAYGSNHPEKIPRQKIFLMSMLLSILNLELSRPDGETTIHVSADDSTVAIWHHVNHWKMPFIMQILFIVNLISTVGWRAFRFVDTFSRVDEAHPTDPHMHLFIIGTNAAMQGMGTGSIVLSKMLQHCDSHGIPAYLESSNERNLPFYTKHGFEITSKIPNMPHDCPPLFALWREPKPVCGKVQD